MNEHVISDEQVDQLNNHEPVKQARTEFIKKMTEYVKNRTPELLVDAEKAEVEYREIFDERLKDVVENPPQPKSVPLKGFTGFKTR